MLKLTPTIAQQVAQAASAFQFERTGHPPKSVSAVLCEDTLIITLRGVLTPAEHAMAKTPAGAAQVHEFHRTLFTNASHMIREQIKKITGVAVCDAVAQFDIGSSTAIHSLATGTMVQVFFLNEKVPTEVWNGVVGNTNGGGDKESSPPFA